MIERLSEFKAADVFWSSIVHGAAASLPSGKDLPIL
jgi:hypothetical protein